MVIWLYHSPKYWDTCRSAYRTKKTMSNGKISWLLGQAKYYLEMADCTKIAIG